MDGQAHITISMEEYKELLIIKGRYEELKTKYTKLVVDKPNNFIGDVIGRHETPIVKNIVKNFGAEVTD